MNHLRCVTIVCLLIALAALPGCKSKQEQPAATPAAPPQSAGDTKYISGEKTAGAPTVSPQDMADARAAAIRVLAQVETGDFAGIYKNSAPGFKEIGPEAAFVAKFQQTRQHTGVLGNPRELNFGVRPDKSYVLVYRIENARFKTDMRLSFTRSADGKMTLAGLNQHDEPKSNK